MIADLPNSDPFTLTLFSPQNPFWHDGICQMFKKKHGEQIVAFSHPKYILDEKKYVAFGFWSASPNIQVDRIMFSEIEKWAKAQGAEQLVGPLNFKTCYDYRLRLDYFDVPPFHGEPFHPDFYPKHLFELGFMCHTRYFTDYITDLAGVREIARQRLPRLLTGFNEMNFVPFDMTTWKKHQGKVASITNETFAPNPAFFPLNAFDFELLFPVQVLERLCPNTSWFAFDPNNNLIGYCVTFPDPRMSKRLLVKTIAVSHEHRHGGRSFVAALNRIFETSTNYDEIAFCLMVEDNAVHRLTKKYADRSQPYGLFTKNL